jgi:hypothetical protein
MPLLLMVGIPFFYFSILSDESGLIFIWYTVGKTVDTNKQMEWKTKKE